MTPMQEIRSAIHAFEGREFKSSELSHLQSYSRNIYNMHARGELFIVGKDEKKRVIYKATNQLRPVGQIKNPDVITRRAKQVEAVKVKPPKEDGSLPGWREVFPELFKDPKMKHIGKTVHQSELLR